MSDNNIIFERISFAEIKDILDCNKTESTALRIRDLQDMLSPIYSALQKLNMRIDNIHYLALDDFDLDNDGLINAFKQYSEFAKFLSAVPYDLVTIFSHKFEESDYESLFKIARDNNWYMIADETISENSPLVFMYIHNDLEKEIYQLIQKNMIDIANGANNEQEQISEAGICYYVSYSINEDDGRTTLEKIILSLSDYISNVDDINYIISLIAKRKNVSEDKVFIFGFSLLAPQDNENNFNYIDDDFEEEQQTNEFTFYVNRIIYRINGEEKVYDSYQNIDLCADKNSTEHLAKSIIAQEEHLTSDEIDMIEIISVENIGSGSNESDDYDD